MAKIETEQRGKKRQDITIWLARTEQTGPIQTEPLSAQLKLRESDRDPHEKKCVKKNNTVQTRLLDRRKDTRHFNQTVSRPRHGRAESVHLTTSQRDEVRWDRGSVDRDRGCETPDTNTEISQSVF